MRNAVVCSLFLLVAASVFGHAGEVHTYMGTVSFLHDDGSFMMKTTDGKTSHVAVTENTRYSDANGKKATRERLKEGTRVVVTIGTDGRTAQAIKFAAAKSKKS